MLPYFQKKQITYKQLQIPSRLNFSSDVPAPTAYCPKIIDTRLTRSIKLMPDRTTFVDISPDTLPYQFNPFKYQKIDTNRRNEQKLLNLGILDFKFKPESKLEREPGKYFTEQYQNVTKENSRSYKFRPAKVIQQLEKDKAVELIYNEIYKK
ncbi:Hypothetical_protein [Hexamita inflata]|uniref:Hypothetical_protein n=1 Tax=Hexamita inflata TaxID=28002 RepID=A0AA86PBQ2_9EUKA|nr:Hypothetical protein HINF_LOCUS23233 [Hexamita inflata]